MRTYITDFGAVSDGITVNSAAIQHAIDTCHDVGGGTVVVPAGTFVTGTIWLRDHVELHLEPGSVLLASPDLADYNEPDAYPQNFGCKGEEWNAKHLIIAVGCTDVAVTGFGTIDGNRDAYFCPAKFWGHYCWKYGLALAKDKENLRPGQTMCIVESTDVRVENVTFRQGTCWSLFCHGCENVQIRGVRVFSPKTDANTDGIDIDCCRYVTVSDCLIDTGDDAIAIRCDSKRLQKPQACEYVTITNCVLSSASSAFRIGVGVGHIRHVRISNIIIKESSTAINFMTSFGTGGEAKIEDVHFQNLSADNTAHPLSMWASVGYIRNVTLRDIRVEALGFSQMGGCISNVQLSDWDIHVNREDAELTPERLRERGDRLLGIYGTTDVTLDNVRYTVDNPETWRTGLAVDDNRGLTVRGCVFPALGK